MTITFFACATSLRAVVHTSNSPRFEELSFRCVGKNNFRPESFCA
jgi:hypothetical protein